MKKIYILSILLFLSISYTKAQTTLTTAVDFTVTDLGGNSHNLFTILNSGKYVCLDFFFTTCGPCQATCPYFKQTFTNYGCNTQDVYFMSIDLGNTNAECAAYETTYLGGSPGYPTISGSGGGGNAVVSAYGVTAFPTYILIAPSKTILEQDMYPIGSAASFDAYFSTHSLAYKACSTGITEETLANSISVFPNPAVDKLIIETSNNEKVSAVKVYDVLGKLLIDKKLDGTERLELNVADLEKGIYFMEITTATGKAIKKFNKA
ncbi:MAG: T9SS type A sorting domain-containing protein [Bacteroidetes bacterium]|nr:T9SS type A sorting domain-containing protein [Bacteroidota bacterium]